MTTSQAATARSGIADPAGLGGGQPGQRFPIDILFVEDNDADAYLVQRVLNANPLVGNVVRARDGEEALHLVRDGDLAPGIAIIDLQMPRMDGLTLMRELQDLDVSFAYFVLSSSASTGDMLRAFQCGTSFFLTKASRPDHLALQINTALRQF